jgi:hypothetical protein
MSFWQMKELTKQLLVMDAVTRSVMAKTHARISIWIVVMNVISIVGMIMHARMLQSL